MMTADGRQEAVAVPMQQRTRGWMGTAYQWPQDLTDDELEDIVVHNLAPYDAPKPWRDACSAERSRRARAWLNVHAAISCE